MHNKFASAFDVAVVVLLAVSGLAWLRWGERYGAEGPPLSSATIAPQLAYACAAYTRPPLTGHVNLHASPPRSTTLVGDGVGGASQAVDPQQSRCGNLAAPFADREL